MQNSTDEIIHKSYAEQIEEQGEGMVSTYVPFRNGLMLSAVASLGMSLFPDDTVQLYLGAMPMMRRVMPMPIVVRPSLML